MSTSGASASKTQATICLLSYLPQGNFAWNMSLYQCEKCQRKHQLQAASMFMCHVHPKHLPTHYMLEHEASTFKSSDRGHWLGKHPIPTPKTKGKKCQSKSAQDEIDKRFLELEELLRKLGYKYIRWEGNMPEDAKWPRWPEW
ncbi:hypothetical protein B0H10DRAFT_1946882 [Mycena sp. CBHHK59/15]|nr:hypothetical protein B0H10DRAFT_1946882 [Mycena sp. CBHHK59/15]